MQGRANTGLKLLVALALAVYFVRYVVPIISLVIAGFLIVHNAFGRDLEGRYANSKLHNWFESLRSFHGLCCAEADGRETEYWVEDGSFWVPALEPHGEERVPDEAVVQESNLFGRPLIWRTTDGKIRCFIAGAMN